MCQTSTLSTPAACMARLAMALKSSSCGSLRQSVLSTCRCAWMGNGVVVTWPCRSAGQDASCVLIRWCQQEGPGADDVLSHSAARGCSSVVMGMPQCQQTAARGVRASRAVQLTKSACKPCVMLPHRLSLGARAYPAVRLSRLHLSALLLLPSGKEAHPVHALALRLGGSQRLGQCADLGRVLLRRP